MLWHRKLSQKRLKSCLKSTRFTRKRMPGGDAKVLCKIFNPYGSGSWYITEAEKLQNGDYRCFGLVNLYETELGYFMLSELLNARINVFGLRMPLERDTYFVGKTLRDAYKDCGAVCIFDKKAA